MADLVPDTPEEVAILTPEETLVLRFPRLTDEEVQAIRERWLAIYSKSPLAIVESPTGLEVTRSPHAHLLGKRVHAKIDTHIVVTGVLLSVGDMGSIVIRDDADENHHCWPMLDIEEAK